MKQSFYVYNNGDLKRKDNTLQFTNHDGEKRDIPVERISDIYVMSEMSFNTAFINYISQYGIPMHFFNYYNFYTGSYYPRETLLAGRLLVRQVEHYTDYEKRIVLARKFIEAAADNIYRNLRYYNGRGKDVSVYMKEVDSFRKQIGSTTTIETVVLLSHKKPDGHINVKVEFGEGEGKVPLDNIAKRAESYKPKERVTYKMIKEYIEAKYGFKVHTAYIAEVKRDLGLPMYDAPNAVEELKQPRKHSTPEKVEAIKDALKHFEVI